MEYENQNDQTLNAYHNILLSELQRLSASINDLQKTIQDFSSRLSSLENWRISQETKAANSLTVALGMSTIVATVLSTIITTIIHVFK